MPFLKMLIGLPASGKSTYARALANSDSNWIHLSSDDIAYNKFTEDQSIDHQEVFQELFQKTVTCLESGKNVIYDATNLASKKRRSFLNRIEKLRVHTEAIIFITPYDLLRERNNARESRQRVPPHILERYIRAFQFPRKDEKFDKISIITDKIYEPSSKSKMHSEKIQNLNLIESLSYNEWLGLYELFEVTQPYLKLSKDHPIYMSAIHQKNYRAYKQMRREIQDPYDQELMAWVIFLHGIGKAYVRKKLPIDEDNFYGFEHASMYVTYPLLSSLHFTEPFIFDALLLIDEHVIGRQLKRGKVKRRIGTPNYDRLVNFWAFFE